MGAAIAVAMPLKMSAQQRVTVDKVVAVVGNSGILYSDVYELSKQLERYGRQVGYTGEQGSMSKALEMLLVQKLLFQQALLDSVQIDHNSIAQRVDEEVRAMITEAGSMTQLERQYNQPIFDIKNDLRAQLEETAYAESMRSLIESKVNVIPGEVDNYYRSATTEQLPIVPQQYVYAQITKYPYSMEEAKFKARERLLEMKERINGGETSFEILATLYSEDDETRRRGGATDPMPKQYFDAAVGDAIENLRPGQVSDVVESAEGFELLQMIGKEGQNYRIRRILVRPQYSSEELSRVDNFLDSLAVQIRMDSITFEKAAALYSDDKYSKMNGGVVSNLELLEKNGYPATYATTKHRVDNIQPPMDSYELRALSPGEISGAFASTDFSGLPLRKIIKLIGIIPSHPANIKEDYLDIEADALAQKKNREFDKWITDMVRGMYVRVDPEFRFDDFENKAWFK